LKLGKVIGNVVATVKDPGLEGLRFLIIQGLDDNFQPIGTPYVAADGIFTAGEGDIVYLVSKKEAAIAISRELVPIDECVVGFVEEYTVVETIKKKTKFIKEKLEIPSEEIEIPSEEIETASEEIEIPSEEIETVSEEIETASEEIETVKINRPPKRKPSRRRSPQKTLTKTKLPQSKKKSEQKTP
jgi:microcompartment protein CcmK/EutM